MRMMICNLSLYNSSECHPDHYTYVTASLPRHTKERYSLYYMEYLSVSGGPHSKRNVAGTRDIPVMTLAGE